MNTGTVISKLAQEYPLSMAMSWDNPGLQVGRMNRPVQKVYVALDATVEVIQECAEWGAQLLVTHHPLLMSGVKKINSDDMYGRKILAMAENGISHYAMHTNYDMTEMRKLAQEALHLQNAEILEVTGTDTAGEDCGIGSVGELPEQITAGDLTVRRATGYDDAASKCLRNQAELMIAPYLKDRFSFLGV